MICLKWKRQWGGSDHIVWINVRKLDALWRFDKGFYLPRGRSEHIRRLLLKNLATKTKVEMPHVGYWEGRVSFTDGRHRFAWCRDHGVKYMPVTVEGRKQVALFQRLFATKVRVCAVPNHVLDAGI